MKLSLTSLVVIWNGLTSQMTELIEVRVPSRLSQRPDVRTFADINTWTDNRTHRIQKHLIPRAQDILEAYGNQRTKPVGPKLPTKLVFFFAHLRAAHPWHS